MGCCGSSVDVTETTSDETTRLLQNPVLGNEGSFRGSVSSTLGSISRNERRLHSFNSREIINVEAKNTQVSAAEERYNKKVCDYQKKLDKLSTAMLNSVPSPYALPSSFIQTNLVPLAFQITKKDVDMITSTAEILDNAVTEVKVTCIDEELLTPF